MPTQRSSAPQPAAKQQAASSAVAQLPPVCSLPALVINGVSWQRYSLPLRRPLTTGVQTGYREGFLLTIRTQPHGGALQAHIAAGHAPMNGSSTSAAGHDITGVGEVCGFSAAVDVDMHPTARTLYRHDES